MKRDAVGLERGDGNHRPRNAAREAGKSRKQSLLEEA